MAGEASYDLRHFADILDTLDAIVWEADASTFEFTYVSKGATSILGYPPVRWVGVAGFWESLIHPDDRESTVAFCLGAVRECRDHRFEYRVLTADGRVIWLEDVVRVVADDNGTARLLRGVMTDITARKETEERHATAIDALKKSEELLRHSEERYRLLSELTSDYAWSVLVDPSGDIHLEWVTGAFEELYGAPFDQGLMDDWTKIVHPEDHATAFGLLERLLRGESVEAEVRLGRPDGATLWVAVAARPLAGPDGSILRIVGSARDVTERRHAEKESKDLQHQLMQAQKMEAVGRLAGGIAHDFNNVLAAILNYAEFIRDNPADADSVRSDAVEIFEAAERAAALVRQLLVFSRRETAQPQRLNLTRVVMDHARMLQRTLGEDIRLSFELHQDGPDIVADRLQIEQVLLNLAVNARDAMPTGGTLEIAVAAEGDRASVSVTDSGTGMSEEVRRRAFEPFFTTKGPGTGTGLGLSMVYGVVEEMGGSIAIDSTEGRGTCVTIDLPVAGEGDGAVPAAAPLLSTPTLSLSILLVEDEGPLRKLVTRVLSADGHEVLAAGDGDEALAIADGLAEPVDLLLTDIVMPGMSGIDLAGKLKERWPQVGILYLSGYPRDVIEAQGGIDAPLLEKPFTAASLRDAIAKLRPAG
ncbi:MAG TPA: PAS domain S-box protein [Actinomycetota bacterium]|nr:PAS domain S-box protein [Actinomycetota bacterium]